MQTKCSIDAAEKSFPVEAIFELSEIKRSDVNSVFDRMLHNALSENVEEKDKVAPESRIPYDEVRVNLDSLDQCLSLEMIPTLTIIKYAFLYWRLLFLSDFKRRRVQSSTLVNESTVRHKYTIDIDYHKVVSAQNDINLSGKVFLPVLKGLELRPLLSVDCDDESGNAMLLSRARENRAVQSLALLGVFLKALFSKKTKLEKQTQLEKYDYSWVRPLLLKLFRLTYAEEIPADTVEWFKKSTELGVIKDSFIEEIQSCLKIEEYLKYCVKTFPLTVLVDPMSKPYGLIKLTVIDELNKNQKKQKLWVRAKDWFFSNVSPKSINLSLAEFGRHSSACHARVIAPEGLVIKGVSLQCFPEDKLRFVRRSESLQMGILQGLRWQAYKYCQDENIRAHVIFNEEQVEIHDVSLHEVTFDNKGYQSQYEWNVVVDLIPRYGITHIPAVILFFITSFTFFFQAFIAVSSIISVLLNFAIASVSFASMPRAFSWMFRNDRIAISFFALVSLLGSFIVDAWKTVFPDGTISLSKQAPGLIFAYIFALVCILLLIRIHYFAQLSYDVRQLSNPKDFKYDSKMASDMMLIERVCGIAGIAWLTWLVYEIIFGMYSKYIFGILSG